MAVGNYLAPKQSPRPMPRPQQQTTILGNAPRGQTDNFISALTQSPAGRAMMLQMASSLFAGRGLGPAFSQGLGAAGRASVADAQMARQREQDALARQKAAARSGGGGGGSSNPNAKAQEEFEKARREWLKDNMENYDMTNPEERIEADRLATLYAMQVTPGMEAMSDAYNRMDPNGRPNFLDKYARLGPAGGEQLRKDLAAQKVAAAETEARVNKNLANAETAPGMPGDAGATPGMAAPNPAAVPNMGVATPALPDLLPENPETNSLPSAPVEVKQGSKVPAKTPGNMTAEERLRRAMELSDLPESAFKANPALINEWLGL